MASLVYMRPSQKNFFFLILKRKPPPPPNSDFLRGTSPGLLPALFKGVGNLGRAETMHSVLFVHLNLHRWMLLISLELLIHQHFWQLLSARPVLGSGGCRTDSEAAPVLGGGGRGWTTWPLVALYSSRWWVILN